MTAQNTLRAAFKRKGLAPFVFGGNLERTILEAMEQHRREGLEEVADLLKRSLALAQEAGLFDQSMFDFDPTLQGDLKDVMTASGAYEKTPLQSEKKV